MVTCSWLEAWSSRRPEADSVFTCTCCVETPAMVATLDCTDAGYVELDPDGSVLVPDGLLPPPPAPPPPPPELQAWVLHACCESPTHDAPPFDGAGLVQERVEVPPPHVAEQALQADQPPSTATAVVQVEPLQPDLHVHVAVAMLLAGIEVLHEAVLLAAQELHGLKQLKSKLTAMPVQS
jgi:hypothetical protein